MRQNTYSISTKDNLMLFVQTWRPEKYQKLVLLVHGLGEHSTRYSHWAEYFNEKDYAFMSFDLRGHGLSDGKRGHIPSYKMMMSDLDLIFKKARELFPDIPVLFYGHSMGGNLAINYVLRNNPQIERLIITSPWLKLHFTPSKIAVTLAKIVNSFYPEFSQSSNLNAEHLSHDKYVVEEYREDQLVHNRITARAFIEVAGAGEWALKNAEKLTVPALLMHGTADKITSWQATKQWAQDTSKTTFKSWPDAYHELHNELSKQEVFEYIWMWLHR